MPRDWPLTTLADVCEEVRYGYTASATDRPTGTRFLRVTDISSGTVNWARVPYCEISDDELARHRLKPGDIVISRMGTIGVSALVQEPVRAVAASYLIRHRIRESCADPRFISYVLRSPQFWHFIWSHGGSGAVQPNINARVLGQFSFPLPPLPEQRAIAHVLGTLDDKIALNRSTNETLEAMARALFKSWFVDFDPVRAKAEGRDPGLPPDLAALFPDGFEDSELGEIPRGWEVGTLADYAELNPESWSESSAPGSIEYLDLSNVKWGRIEGVQRYLRKDAPSRARRVLKPGDTIIGTVRPGNGSYALIQQSSLTGSTGFAVLRPFEASYTEFVYFTATAPSNIERLSHLADGAAYPAVRPNVVLNTTSVRPGGALIQFFATTVKLLMARIVANERESRSLEGLRDALLPRMLSGTVHP